MRILLDSNILLRWVKPSDSDQVIVASALNHLLEIDADLFYTSQNLGEFWNTLTRPINKNGYGLSPEEANRRAASIESKIELLADSLAVHETWRRLIVDYRVSGVQVHDARLVAAMHVHNVKRILTFNTREFTRFTDIEAIHPASIKTDL